MDTVLLSSRFSQTKGKIEREPNPELVSSERRKFGFESKFEPECEFVGKRIEGFVRPEEDQRGGGERVEGGPRPKSEDRGGEREFEETDFEAKEEGEDQEEAEGEREAQGGAHSKDKS
jgi:hypothetical protein